MTAQIEEITVYHVLCDECVWSPPPFGLRTEAEQSADGHDAIFHSGVDPEGEDG